MIEEEARVTATEGDFAWVEKERRAACDGCAVNKGCGTAVLSKVLGRRRARVRALNAAGARVGDEVVIGIREQALVQGSVLVYAVPLLALLVGAALGAQLGGGSEGLSVLLGMGGLGLSLLWVHRYATRRLSRDTRYQPVILRRVGQAAFPVRTANEQSTVGHG
jgi:sigma-E factor negative regulatory protein RseC